jgi:hypothetical protein
MRYTGLRIEQAAWVYREDLDFDGCTLVVRKGKSRKEKALMRRVEASPHLFADLGDETGSASLLRGRGREVRSFHLRYFRAKATFPTS